MQKARGQRVVNTVCFGLNKHKVRSHEPLQVGGGEAAPTPPICSFPFPSLSLPRFSCPCSIWCVFTGTSRCSSSREFSSGPRKTHLLEPLAGSGEFPGPAPVPVLAARGFGGCTRGVCTAPGPGWGCRRVQDAAGGAVLGAVLLPAESLGASSGCQWDRAGRLGFAGDAFSHLSPIKLFFFMC